MRIRFIMFFLATVILQLICAVSFCANNKLSFQEKSRLKKCFVCLSKTDLAEYVRLPETIGVEIRTVETELAFTIQFLFSAMAQNNP